MSKKLVQILYNPSSLHTADAMTKSHESIQNEERNEQALQILDDLIANTRTIKSTFASLISLKRSLMYPVDKSTRLIFLKNYNQLLKSYTSSFTNEIDIFQVCVQLTTLLKEQVETRPHETSAILKSEWIELEKMIYQLSTWESQLEHFWSSAH